MTAMTLGEQLRTVRIGPEQTACGLQVFALHWEPAGSLDYRTLDESVASDLIAVTEVDSAGSVPTLKVSNKGEKPVFLMAGEHLCGGKQNRVLNASILVPANSELPIPVSCVEHGRWAYRSQRFAGSGSSSHSALRKMMHSQVTKSYRDSGTPTSDQGEVWREVSRKLTETGSHSDTMYLNKAYEDSEPMLREVAEQMLAPEGASGAVFAYGGKIIGLDLFSRPATLAGLWPKLLRAYAIDARVAPEHTPVSAEQIRDWLAAFAEAKQEVFPSAGLGEDVRLESDRLAAACLRVEEHPIHVEAFTQAV